MKYGLLKEGAKSLFIRTGPGGFDMGTLYPNVKFYLTGKTVTNQLEWSEGWCEVSPGKRVQGWVASKWLTIHDEVEDNSILQSPELPPLLAPALKPFRNWQEAAWQLAVVALLVLAVWFCVS